MSEEDPPTPFPLNPIYNPNDWRNSTFDGLDIAYLNANYLKFNVAQGTENFNQLNADIIGSSANLSLNPTGVVRCGKTLDMSGNDIQNTNLVHSQNNNDIVIEGKGTGDVILKSNATNGLVMTDGGTINIFYPITMRSDVGGRREIQTSSVNFSSAGVNPYDPATRCQIFTSGSTFALINLQNSGTTQLQVRDGGGNNVNVLQANSTEIRNARPISMNDATASNRTIDTSFLRLTENTGAHSATALGQITQNTTTMNVSNLVNSGTINLNVKNAGGTDITPLQLTATNNTIPANVGLTMSAGTGFINQPTTLNSTTGNNSFKKSEITINNNNSSGSSTSALEVYNTNSGRGLFILPDSSSGTLNSIVQANDCFFGSRAPQNNNAITISNWGSTLNGIRIATTDASSCSISIRNGTNTIAMTTSNVGGNRVSNPTAINHNLNFNNATPSLRQIENLGTLNFLDVSGNSSSGARTTTIFMDTSANVPGMFYDCSLNNGSHNFVVNDNLGVKKTPVFFGSALTSVLNTFSVRNETTTSFRFDVATSGAAVTTMRARNSTPSTSSQLIISADTTSAGGITTTNSVVVVNPTNFTIQRPLQFNYLTTQNSPTQLGHITGPISISSGSVSSSVNERNFSNFTIVNAGTYSIQVLITLAGGANHTLTECRFCLDGTSATFPSTTTPTKYTPSITGLVGNSLSNTYTSYMNIELNVLASANNVFHINYVLNYPGGSSTTLNAIYSYTRIG